MRKHIRKKHNVTMLLYHLVMPVKYRRKVFTTQRIENVLIEECAKLESKQIYCDSIGIDGDHVHILVQSVPMLSVTKIVTMIKSLTAKALLGCKTELYGKLWGSEFWTDGYYANTVGVYAGFQTIQNYVQNQGKAEKRKIEEYKQVYDNSHLFKQQSLFQ